MSEIRYRADESKQDETTTKENTAMMKQEFEALVKKEVGNTEYSIIECVYMYHPAIDSKETIAKIFKMKEGYSIICDMYSRAAKLEEVETLIQARKAEIARLVEQANKIKKA